MSEETVVSLTAFKLTKEQEDLIVKNKDDLKSILNIYFDTNNDIYESRAFVDHMVENTSTDIVTESLFKFATAFNETISAIMNTTIIPPDITPFDNDPSRFMAWSLIASALHPHFDPKDVVNVLRMMKTVNINELVSSTREQFQSFLNDPYNYENIRPISEAPEEDGFEAYVMVKDKLIKGQYECGHTWGWIDKSGNWIYPSHFIKE